MGLGVLEVTTAAHVPGTVVLEQDASPNATTVLSPQPSDDPNDPLNWSLAKKHTVLFIICLGTIVHVAVAGPLLTSGTVQIAMELKESLTSITKLAGYIQLAAGALGPFASAFARKYGKRPVYLFASVMALIGCIIGECANDYSLLVAARLFQGFSMCAYEALMIPSVGDMFFVNERGPRIALALFTLNAITNVTQIIAGTITNHLGWKYNFHVLVPFTAVQFLLALFFMPETCFRRDIIQNVEPAEPEKDQDVVGSNVELESVQAKTVTHEGLQVKHETRPNRSMKPKTFIQSMAVFNGTFTSDSIVKMVIACPLILVNAGASFVVFGCGLVIVWSIGISILSSIIFASPPYLYSTSGVGYLSVAPLIGALVSSLLMGFLSDRLVRKMSRKNGNVFEPEFELASLAIGGAVSIASLVGLGYAVEAKLNVYLVCFVWGLTSFGLTVITICTNTYGLAAFAGHTTEIFVMNMTFRNFFGYGLTNFVVDWYLENGAKQVTGVFAGATGFCCLCAIPLYIFGKRYRNFWHHHNILRILRLDTDNAGAYDGLVPGI